MNRIVNQKALARRAGVTEKHLSNLKNRKGNGSAELYATLEDLTGIKAMVWATAPKPTLKRKVREFFAQQKLLLLGDKQRERAAA